MNGGGAVRSAVAQGPKGRLSVLAPWPLVGIALLLVALIVITPVLVANTRQPAPGILTQAELVVDKVQSNATLTFYVWALGETIRYDTISVGIATSFNWTGTTPMPWSGLNWTEWHNGSDVLSVIINSSANPVAVAINVYYAPGGGAHYGGVLAFYVSQTTPTSSESLYSATNTSGVAVASPLAVSNDTLPVPILLAIVGSAGVLT